MFESLRSRIEPLLPNAAAETLSPESAEKLYGATLETSVSALEKFAACPMQFFISAGLRAEERRVFELDVRERGKFQHAILENFHKELREEKKRWREISPEDAREKIARIGRELKTTFRDGLLDSEAQNEFQAESMIRSLQDFIVTAIGWMRQYEFDPEAVELRFGLPEANLPAWEIEIDGGQKLAFRGTMDRVDLHRMPGSNEALAVVIDYKSSAKKIDAVLLKNGVQLQLPAYLAFLRQLADPEKIFSINKIIPAGVFYVNLRGEFRGGKTRNEILDNLDASRQQAYRHTGRFDFCALKFLDNRNASNGTQFNYRLRNNGQPYASSGEVLSSDAFGQMLDGIEQILREMGRRIFSGETQIDPYQKGNVRACDHCDYGSICRIDAWRHNFRVLKKQSSE
jgi:ATP-dependent helicase/nuclease subunit B